MELLLNLLWISLVPLAVIGFLRSKSVSGIALGVSRRKAIVAIGFAIVLLFPFVSASDDLHPTQAVVEDSSKRVKQAVAVARELQAHPPQFLLLAMLALCLMFALVVLRRWRPLDAAQVVPDGVVVTTAGRSPPYSYSS